MGSSRTIWLWSITGVAVLLTLLAGAFAIGYRMQRYQRVVIVGPSMAPALLGRHGTIHCEACGRLFQFDLEGIPVPSRVICPNCGEVIPSDGDIAIKPGDEAWLDTQPTSLARFDVIGLHVPDDPDTLGVKRIIGLPGETVSIAGGDVFIDGQALRKSLGEASTLSTAVHSDMPGRKQLASRWQIANPSGHWSEDATHSRQRIFTFEAKPQTSEIEWLTYQHGRSFDSPGPAPTMLLDNDSYNQSLARELNEVFDYNVTLRLVEADFETSQLVIAVHDGWQRWQVEFAQDTVQVRCGDVLVKTVERPLFLEHPVAGSQISVSVCDEQVRLDTEGRELLRVDIDPPAGTPRKLPADFLAIGASGTKVQISAPWIRRDIHYLHPHGTSAHWTLDRPLGPDEYFVLGDNPPVSIDSRQFGPVKRANILGKVIAEPTLVQQVTHETTD